MPNRQSLILAAIAVIATLAAMLAWAQTTDADSDDARRLAVVWTSGDADVAHRMVLMYTHVAVTAGWWDEVELIVWGPSQRILVGDHDLQDKIHAMQADGIRVRACIMCAGTYGITEELRGIGLEVLPMGQPLTEYLQDPGWTVVTF